LILATVLLVGTLFECIIALEAGLGIRLSEVRRIEVISGSIGVATDQHYYSISLSDDITRPIKIERLDCTRLRSTHPPLGAMVRVHHRDRPGQASHATPGRHASRRPTPPAARRLAGVHAARRWHCLGCAFTRPTIADLRHLVEPFVRLWRITVLAELDLEPLQIKLVSSRSTA
jgi:hypothetical protein